MNRGRDRFNESNGDDQPTQYIGNSENQPTEYIGRAGDQPTEYLGGAGSYNPDADFAGGGDAGARGAYGSAASHRAGNYGAGNYDAGNETRFDYPHEPTQATEYYGPNSGGRNTSDTGQYWAPLTPEERGYGQGAAGAQSHGHGGASHSEQVGHPGRPGQYGAGAGNRMAPRQQRGRKNKPQKSRGSGWGKSAAVVSVVAILAILTLVVLMMNFASNNTAKPSTRPTTPTQTSAPSASEPTPSSPITSAQDRVQEEIDRLKKNPPALPGVGDVTSGWGTIPVGVVGKSPAVVQAELAANGYLNVKVFDRNGRETNSAMSALGKVASIDPPGGQAATTDTQVNIYLQ